jgi:hypothetical protein
MSVSRGFAVLLLALLVSGPAWSKERFALIIGANMGWSQDRPLRYAESDAEHLRDVLVELGGFAPDRVVLLLDPGIQAVRDHLHGLDEALRASSSGSLLFFYYAGHADSQNLHLRDAPLSHAELASLLRKSSGSVRIGVLDSCRAGSVLVDKDGSRPAFELQVLDELEASGLAVLSSTGADELSQEQRGVPGSLFTLHFISALRGAADADDDGQVTLAEAYQHALLRTQADTSTSTVSPPSAFGRQVVLSQLIRAASLLLLPRSDGERFVVTDRQEWRLFAEASPHPERQVWLAVAPGEYHVNRMTRERLVRASVQLTPGTRMDVTEVGFEPRPYPSRWDKGLPAPDKPEQLRAWQRAEALRLLAAGEARAALRLFNRMRKKGPGDAAVQRGRSRALLRLSEAHSRVGNRLQALQALHAALEADPFLAKDPDFLRWYGPAWEKQQAQHRELEARALAAAEHERNPRWGRSWGIGFELSSPKGYLTLSSLRLLSHGLAPYLTLDIVGEGVSGGVQWSPDLMLVSWRPWVRWGLRMSMKRLGIDYALSDDPAFEAALDERSDFSTHLEVGGHCVLGGGLSLELGMGMLLYGTHDGKRHLEPWPVLGVQWLF